MGEHHVRQDPLTSQGEAEVLSKISSKPFMSQDGAAAHPARTRWEAKTGVVTPRYSLGTSLFTNYDTQPRGLALSLLRSLSLEGVLARPRAPGVTSHLRRGGENASRLAHPLNFRPIPRTFTRQDANNHYRLRVITMHGSAIIYLAFD